MIKRSAMVVAALLVALLAPPAAVAWNADFFDKDASGNASYEEMVISPQAVYDSKGGAAGRTYLAYQGNGLNPYVIGYDHATDGWIGPFVIGENDLAHDFHGAPSIVVDKSGYIFAFYGGHLGSLNHSRSARPHDVTDWVDLGPVRAGGVSGTTISASYPQPTLEDSGTIRLYYRRDDDTGHTRGDWESVVTSVPALVPEWSAPDMLLDGTFPERTETIEGTPTAVSYYWYVDVDDSGDGSPAFAAVRRDYNDPADPRNDNMYVRKGVYYAERSTTGTWTSAFGEDIAPERRYESLQATAAVLAESDAEGTFTNQVVVQRDGAGVPGVLYLAGSNVPGEPYSWHFARPDGDDWRDVVIGDGEVVAETDDLFDAGTFEFMADGSIEAFLTTGGEPDDQWIDDLNARVTAELISRRGGDISRWRSTDGGATWQEMDPVLESPGPHARYNNPQIIRDHNGGVRLLFSEWNNDASNFIHKVYLWGDAGFKQRVFTPQIVRLAGQNRMETAVAISQKGFPFGASTAVIATANNFPDALCGVPLAHALRAPVLLNPAATLSPVVAAELDRLNVSTVILLGSDAVLSESVATSVRGLRTSTGAAVRVERIAGANRYETSAKIADRVALLRGIPTAVVLASGETFPDALTVSPYAARRGYPIMLTPKNSGNPITSETIASFAPERIIVVGSDEAIAESTVDAYAAAAYTYAERWAGSDRYATARVIAEHAVAEGQSMERFSLATGSNYADAVAGGLLAARFNSVLLMTQPTYLSGETRQAIETLAFGDGSGVLDAYVLGGTPALTPEVENQLADLLHALDVRSMLP